MNNLANHISVSRIILSLILLVIDPHSFVFCIIYIYCGLSDMLDGFIAKKTKSESKPGARLDSIADLVFVVVAMIKILPILNLTSGIIVWAILIALIKIINIVYSYTHHKIIALPHTTANKITGFVLFIAPFVIANTNPLFEVIICSIATFAAIQEWYYIYYRNSLSDLPLAKN